MDLKVFLLILFVSLNIGVGLLVEDEEWMNVCGKQKFLTCLCPMIDKYKAEKNSTIWEDDKVLSKTCQHLGLAEDCSHSGIQQYDKAFCLKPTRSELGREVEIACKRFGINDTLDCSCPRLYHASNRTHQCPATSKESQQLSTENSNDNSAFDDLQGICKFFNINASICKCPEITNINSSFIEICKFLGLPVVAEAQCNVDPYTRGRKIFVVIVSIFGIVGNSLVILIRSQQWGNSIHYRLISGLAFSDLTFSILQIIFNAPAINGSCKWGYGLAMCKLYALLGIGYSIDLGFAVIISIERYIAIVHPLSNSFEKRNVFIFVLINIMYSIIGVLPAIIVLEISKAGICKENWDGFSISSLDYTWIVLLFYFVFPVLLIAMLYNKSMCALHKSILRRMSAIHTASKTKLLVENRRILLVMNTIVVTLVLLVSPYHIYWMIVEYVGIKQLGSRTLAILQFVAFVPYSLTVMVNPVIYSLVDRHFRVNAKYLLLHLKHRKRSYSSSNTLHTLVPSAERPIQPPLLSRRKSSV